MKQIAWLCVLFSMMLTNSLCSDERQDILTEGLPLHGVGLEIAPFYRPTVLKKDHRIFYTDYTTAEELIRKHSHLPQAREIAEKTVPLDFIWAPQRPLIQSVPLGVRFDYTIASHVIEHVPNVIGWLVEILDVLQTGGVLSLAIPDMNCTFDAYRRETEVHELIDVWVRNQRIPSPGQIFDCLSHGVDVGSQPYRPRLNGVPFENLNRSYSDEEALRFACSSHAYNTYYDIHCTTFTPEGIVKTLSKLCELGLLNVSISEPIIGWSEFFIKLIKLGEPRIRHPGV